MRTHDTATIFSFTICTLKEYIIDRALLQLLVVRTMHILFIYPYQWKTYHIKNYNQMPYKNFEFIFLYGTSSFEFRFVRSIPAVCLSLQSLVWSFEAIWNFLSSWFILGKEKTHNENNTTGGALITQIMMNLFLWNT